MKNKLRIGLAMAVMVIGMPALALCQEKVAAGPVSGNAIRAGEIGSRLPDFAVNDLRGHNVSSADLRGKIVLVDFWATWCRPCKKEMPGYQKLLDRYGKDGFVVVGFKFDTMVDDIDPLIFARRIGVHYPLAIATDGIRAEFGGIEGLPTTMIYDRQGILRYKVIGFEYTGTIESELK
ncbi:MAG: TlpA family protein disulfide reductase, partial [Blastocatellia bacterium]